MPLEKIDSINSHTWALWKIEEDENTLAIQLSSDERIPDSISNSKKRLEWFAGRLLVKNLIEKLGIAFQGVTKDEFGKPFLKGSAYQLSLSHSYPYVAASVHKELSVGIDLEQPKTKLLRIAPRVLNINELEDAGENVTKHCIYWCAKETLIKVYGKKDLTLAEHLKITPFSLEKQGHLIGRIIVNDIATTVPLWYSVTENFVVVLSI
jgi:4'-phosphopantetheinyl transferase